MFLYKVVDLYNVHEMKSDLQVRVPLFPSWIPGKDKQYRRRNSLLPTDEPLPIGEKMTVIPLEEGNCSEYQGTKSIVKTEHFFLHNLWNPQKSF